MSAPRPVPMVDPDSAPYWESAARGVLRIQYCKSCGGYFFYPRLRCPQCWGADLSWVEVSGGGTVYSYTVIHRAPHEALADRVPYVVALIDLAEGPRLMATLEGVDPERVRIGMPVQVAFEKVTDDVVLPVFKAAGT